MNLYDFTYTFNLPFVRGEVIPAAFSFQSLFSFFLPVLMSIVVVMLIRKWKKTLLLGNLMVLAAVSALPVFLVRKAGYLNSTSRYYAAARSLYFHSFLLRSGSLKPLNRTEQTDLLSLRKRLFFQDSASDVTLRRGPVPAGLRPNIIVVVLESFPRKALMAEVLDRPLSPHLRQAMQKGRYFSKFYNNAEIGTCKALWTMLSGEPSVSGYDMFFSLPRFRFPLVTETLKRNGYRNYWFHGNTSQWGNRGDIFKRHGFDYLFDQDSLPRNYPAQAWGIPDLNFFTVSTDILDSLSGTTGPYLAMVLSISTHHPFMSPPQFHIYDSVFSGDQAAELNSLHYADFSVGVLLDWYFREKRDRDTYLIITCDNGYKHFERQKSAQTDVDDFAHIFCILVGPGIPAAGTDSLPASHMDIASTITDVAGLSPRFGLGHSLLSGARSGWLPLLVDKTHFIIVTPGFLLSSQAGVLSGAPLEDELRTAKNRLSDFSAYQMLWSRMMFNDQNLPFPDRLAVSGHEGP
jgi:phosphoglycerol transferase MdoB-like AlkP superfamily enzyme